MSKRQELSDLIQANINQIHELKKANIELTRESILLCDDEQWFEEKMEMTTQKENGKKVKVERLIGRIHWKQVIDDMDTLESITVNRSQVVRVDGRWDW